MGPSVKFVSSMVHFPKKIMGQFFIRKNTKPPLSEKAVSADIIFVRKHKGYLNKLPIKHKKKQEEMRKNGREGRIF